MGDPDDVRARVTASLEAIDRADFEPTPGRWCRRLPVVLRHGPCVGGGSVRVARLQPLDLLGEPAVVRRRIEPAHRHARHEDRGTRPVSSGTRTCATARHHSRSPGWRNDSPFVPGKRSAGSSITTGSVDTRARRSLQVGVVGLHEGATVHPRDTRDGGRGRRRRRRRSRRGRRRRLGRLLAFVELDPERAHRERAVHPPHHPRQRGEQRPGESASSFTSRRNDERGTMRATSASRPRRMRSGAPVQQRDLTEVVRINRWIVLPPEITLACPETATKNESPGSPSWITVSPASNTAWSGSARRPSSDDASRARRSGPTR